MLCFLFVPAFDYKIYCLMLYHLLKSTLHLKANACSIGTFIRFYMQSSLHSKANACNIGTFIRFYIQMRVQIKNKAFAYRFYRPFTQQWGTYSNEWRERHVASLSTLSSQITKIQFWVNMSILITQKMPLSNY